MHHGNRTTAAQYGPATVTQNNIKQDRRPNGQGSPPPERVGGGGGGGGRAAGGALRAGGALGRGGGLRGGGGGDLGGGRWATGAGRGRGSGGGRAVFWPTTRQLPAGGGTRTQARGAGCVSGRPHTLLFSPPFRLWTRPFFFFPYNRRLSAWGGQQELAISSDAWRILASGTFALLFLQGSVPTSLGKAAPPFPTSNGAGHHRRPLPVSTLPASRVERS